ncbi:MAG: PAS domain S-box protein [Nostoc sp. TH1S01]|nr:PAS domain S-box protein [Nostoc sp. TH1S01]
MFQHPYLTIVLLSDCTEEQIYFRQYLQHYSLYNYQLLEFESAAQLVTWCQQKILPDVILLNFSWPDGSELKLLRELRQILHNTKSAIILVTERDDAEIAVLAMKNGAQDYLVKNHLTPATLQAAIHDVVEHRQQYWQLEQRRERKRLITATALLIRQSLDLKEILAVTVKEIQQYLQTDRVLVYQFHPDMSGTVISESVLPGWSVSLEKQIQDTCFQQGAGVEYRQGKTRAINNIYDAGLTDCHIQLLEKFEVKAYLVVPILVSKCLWGLLIAHQCTAPRYWQAEELEFLDQLAVQIAIAIQQANTYEIAQKEIKERRRTEKNLRDSEERFRNTFEQAAVGIGHVSLNGQFIRVNQRFADITGYSQPELLSLTFQEITHPDDLADNLQQAQMLLAGQIKNYSMEKRYLRKDSEIIWIKLTVSLVCDHFSHPQYFISVIEDISQQKQAEIDLQESESRFQAFMNNSPSASWITDADGRIVYVSQTYLHTFQVKAETIEDLIGRTLFDIYPQQIAQQFVDNIRQVTQIKKVLEVIEQAPKRDGTQGYFLVYKFPLAQNSATCLVGGVAVDITERIQVQKALQQLNQELEARVEKRTASLKQSEQQLRNISDRLKLALQVGEIGIWDWDMLYEAEWDDRMYELYGMQRSEIPITYEDWRNAVYPDDLAETEADFQAAISGEKDFNREFRILHPDGSIHFIRTAAIVQRNHQGEPQRMVGINYDVTERKLAETQLQQTNEQLIKSNAELTRATRLKDEFLANMSHELRTPLNAILGMSEALQEGIFGILNEKQKHSLQTIESSGSHLLELINDILDLSKIEAGQLNLNYTQIAINELCQSSLVFIKHQAFQKNIHVEMKIQPQLPKLLIDERRICQALINLLNNAVKFTPKGGRITLEATHQSLASPAQITSATDFIRIAVIDTGIGIAEENLQKLFQPFVQIDSALNRQYAGTGLGLTLVKRLVEMHGGYIEVTSKLDVGSCFSIYLPCENISKLPLEPIHPVLPELNLSGNRTIQRSNLILLIENNKAIIFTISSYLEKQGYQIILATNEPEILAALKTQITDLILIDTQMPNLDALDFIKQLRLNQDFANLPVIVLSASSLSGEREKFLAVGANEHITKPLKLQQLAANIQQILEIKDIKI